MSVDQSKIKNLETALEKINKKEQTIVFLVPDTKGTARASVSITYRQAMVLKNSGYKVCMLTEKKDFTKPGGWLGEEYDQLEHSSIEENNLTVGPSDFIVIPEMFGSIIEQIEHLPLEKIYSVHSYEHMFDYFAPGKSYLDYGIQECITTSTACADLISEVIGVDNVNVIPVGIPEYFKPIEIPNQPVVAIHCKDSRKAAKLIKTFYLKHPLYRFISFKDMHGMTEMDFAEALKSSCVSVWVDDNSTFGTYPLESIKCNIPVIGKIPNIIPDWLSDNNGLWVYDENQIIDILANYIKNWLEDTLPEELLTVSNSVIGKYEMSDFEEKTLTVFEGYFKNKENKLKLILENLLVNDGKENE